MKIVRKIVASVTAAACVVAFNTVAVSSAFAADNSEATVAITVIDNSDPNDPGIIRDCAVTVSASATVADALGAAGFEKVDTIDETKIDPYGTYCLSYDYPYFAGKGYDTTTGNYWLDVYDGELDADGSKTIVTATVVNGAHYQYIYDKANYDEATETASYSFDYADYADLIDDPLSAAYVNTCLSVLPKKFNKNNISSALNVVNYAASVYNALSNAEKEKVIKDVIEVRDSVIRYADNLAVKTAADKTIKAKKNAKKTVTLKAITSASGNKVTYSQKTKNAKVTVSKTGKVTVKKGLKKTVKIKVAAYCGVAASKNITITVKAA